MSATRLKAAHPTRADKYMLVKGRLWRGGVTVSISSQRAANPTSSSGMTKSGLNQEGPEGFPTTRVGAGVSGIVSTSLPSSASHTMHSGEGLGPTKVSPRGGDDEGTNSTVKGGRKGEVLLHCQGHNCSSSSSSSSLAASPSSRSVL